MIFCNSTAKKMHYVHCKINKTISNKKDDTI